MSVLHVAVKGLVQGVGYRWFVRERARALGLAGWVRNRPDGSVEVFATGVENDLLRLRALLRSGPPGATVTAVEDQNDDPSTGALNPFGILR